jgi:outer membrane protein insertion porin family
MFNNSARRIALLATAALSAALMATTALAQPAGGPADSTKSGAATTPPETSAPATPAPAGVSTPAPAATDGPVATRPNPTVTIRRIVVQGNERIESGTVISYMPIAPGDTVDSARIDLAIKTLARTDLFSDVSMQVEGQDLIVKVIENPIINQVIFEGNSNLNNDKLRDEINLHPRSIFTKSHVQADVQKIVELYRRSGRISAVVTPKIVELPQKRVDLVFEINEGPKTGILNVNFLGNKAFNDNTLKDVVVTKESAWYKFFASNDNYDPDRIEYDREQLRKYYTNRGYYDFHVVSSIAELESNQRNFVVTYTIDEGPKYKFGKLTVKTDLKKLNGDVLRLLLPIREGQTYQSDRIENAVDALTFAAGAAGFAFVDIRPRYTANKQTKTVDVVFEVKEGPRVYVERIDIIGNTRTLDPVIRREMRLAEGDAYNRVLVDRSKTEIKRLDFFKTVDIEQLPGSANDKTILRVKVQEQPTGELSFGAGYSSVDRLLLDAGITERNFRGRGQDLRLRASIGSLRQQLDFSFTEPRFQGRDLRAGINLFYYRYDFTSTAGFNSESLGASTTLGFPLSVNAFLQTRYTLSTNNVLVDNALCTAGAISVTICDQRGSSLTSQIGYSIFLDFRNDPIHPTRGFFANLKQDFAGVGGNVRYLSTVAEGTTYYGILPGWTAQLRGTVGYIGGWGNDDVRINNRFFMGGNTFRGFQTAGIGPRDTNPNLQEALGGKLYAIGSAELTVPNHLPDQYGIKTSLFSDFGTLGLVDKDVKQGNPTVKDDLGLRAAAGLSVFWTSPLGPIRLDFSQVLAKETYDKTETFRFSTSTQF